MKAMRVMGLLLLPLLLLTAPGACLPPATCTPSTAGCGDDGDTPTVCSNTGRAWAISRPRVRCAEVGGVCVVRGTTAGCVRPPVDAGLTDAGADAPSNGGE